MAEKWQVADPQLFSAIHNVRKGRVQTTLNRADWQMI
jgi:hypothetical protein